MTCFLNFRAQNVGGAVVDPYLLTGDGTAQPPALSIVPQAQIPLIVAGKNLLLATHGFNVSYQMAPVLWDARSLSQPFRAQPLHRNAVAGRFLDTDR